MAMRTYLVAVIITDNSGKQQKGKGEAGTNEEWHNTNFSINYC